jgi:hypothetical protein
VIAFKGTSFASAVVSPIINLTGTPNAYPYNYPAKAATVFYDGGQTPTGQSVVISDSRPLEDAQAIYGPQGTNDYSICSYQQSMPFVNSHIHYIGKSDSIFDPEAFQPWDNIVNQPSAIFTSVPGYMLLQNGSFILMSYTNTSSHTFNYIATMSLDTIFPTRDRISLLAVTGNSTSYIFLGAKQGKSPCQLVFKQYNPVTGIISELPTNKSYTYDTSFLLQGFIYNDRTSWYILSAKKTTSSIILQGDISYKTLANSSYITYTYSIYN